MSVRYSFNLFLLFLSVLCFLSACGQGSDDQRKFEEAAFSPAEGITETENNGDIVEGAEDTDDWRIAPFFQGVVNVRPAFPNPVLSNNQFHIELFVTGIDGVSGLRVFVIHDGDTIKPVPPFDPNPLPTGAYPVILTPQEIARFPNSPQGTYRIIVTDGRENVITYGDVRVE